MTGYEKLKKAVEKDIADGQDERYMDKFNWIIDRAKHYGEKLGLNWDDVLNSWEEDRTYWYMNYYQECNQPRLDTCLKYGNIQIVEDGEIC